MKRLQVGLVLALTMCPIGTTLALSGLVANKIEPIYGWLGVGMLIGGVMGAMMLARHLNRRVK